LTAATKSYNHFQHGMEECANILYKVLCCECVKIVTAIYDYCLVLG